MLKIKFPILGQMDNRGHRLVATDDSGINTPAIAAAHVIKRYNGQAADEISLQVSVGLQNLVEIGLVYLYKTWIRLF